MQQVRQDHRQMQIETQIIHLLEEQVLFSICHDKFYDQLLS